MEKEEELGRGVVYKYPSGEQEELFAKLVIDLIHSGVASFT